MSFSQVFQPAKFRIIIWPWYALLVGSLLIAYIPTLRGLIDGPWQTEQEGHGPLIIAASLWLVWQARKKISSTEIRSAPFVGWLLLLGGLFLMFLARTQDVLTVEAFSILPVLAGCVLIAAGWTMLGVLAFPIGFLFFAVPMPDWLIDAATVPLKVFHLERRYARALRCWLSSCTKRRHDYDWNVPVDGEGCLLRDEFNFRSLGDRGFLCVCFSLE